MKFIICVGLAKSGTTSFYETLKNFGGYSLSSYKEIDYFGVNQFKIEDYLSNFDLYSTDIYVDVSTQYFLNISNIKEDIQRLKEYGPVSFVIFVRNPIHRSYSHYSMMRYNNLNESEDFDKIVERILKQNDYSNHEYSDNLKKPFYSLSEEEKDLWRYFNYFDTGNYKKYIDLYAQEFGHECLNICSIDSFEIEGYNVLTWNQLCETLGFSEKVELEQSNTAGQLRFVSLHYFIKWFGRFLLKMDPNLLKRVPVLSKVFYFLKNTNRKKREKQEIPEKALDTLKGYYKC